MLCRGGVEPSSRFCRRCARNWPARCDSRLVAVIRIEHPWCVACCFLRRLFNRVFKLKTWQSTQPRSSQRFKAPRLLQSFTYGLVPGVGLSIVDEYSRYSAISGIIVEVFLKESSTGSLLHDVADCFSWLLRQRHNTVGSLAKLEHAGANRIALQGDGVSSDSCSHPRLAYLQRVCGAAQHQLLFGARNGHIDAPPIFKQVPDHAVPVATDKTDKDDPLVPALIAVNRVDLHLQRDSQTMSRRPTSMVLRLPTCECPCFSSSVLTRASWARYGQMMPTSASLSPTASKSLHHVE